MNYFETIRASAPATVANLNVGFDSLGLALSTPREEMLITRRAEPGVKIELAPGTQLSTDPTRNVAGIAAHSALHLRGSPHGVALYIDKTVRPGSGLGSSASSAVAAAVGVSALLNPPLSQAELLSCALDGEASVSGARHADNVAPALYGGLCLNTPDGVVTQLPLPSWHLVALHPQRSLNTAEARQVLPETIPRSTTSAAAAWMGRFVSACYRDEWSEAAFAMRDLYVGPSRAHLIPAFEACEAAALHAGALSGGISGSGPSTFWICPDQATAQRVQAALSEEMDIAQIKANIHLAHVDQRGAFSEPVH